MWQWPKMRLAAEAKAVFGPDLSNRANEDEQDTFEGSWIELH
jgi:hypothetical protein